VNFHGVQMPVVDTHADSLGCVLRGERHLGERSEIGQLDFPRMVEAGHTLQFFSLWVEPEHKPERAMHRLMQYIDVFWQEVGANPELIIPVTDRAGLSQVLTQGILGAVMSVEGAEGLAADPAMVRILHRLGVRLLSLTWNQRNALADGAGEDPGGGGVSRAGRDVIQEMNRCGMVVDVSHLAEAGFWDVLECSVRPVIASHSNCRAIQLHPRNLSDGQIRALAEHDGIQGITFVRDFLGGAENIDRVVDHIMHALDVVGNDRHTALGSDFDGVEHAVEGLEDVTRLPQLAEAMSARGLTDASIGRILGSNYWDFFDNAWR
jgi:membrane dipeptidase